MNIDTYARILNRERERTTPEMQAAFEEQTRLHYLCLELQEKFYVLDDRHRNLIMEGTNILFALHPEARDILESTQDTTAGRMLEIVEGLKDENSDFKKLSRLMKTVPQLAQADALNVEIGKSCLEYFMVLCKLTDKIREGRERFFTEEYSERMDQLADEGILLYFLEMPTFPLLDDFMIPKNIIAFFEFNEFESIRQIFSAVFAMPCPGESMKRKQDDIDSAICNMLSGHYRTAARIWFSLIESEHKKCADTLEGFWEKAREFKNGLQRANKIYEMFDRSVDMEWEYKAWCKIDAYYRKMLGKQTEGIINRNAIIHGDYENPSIEVNSKDVVLLALLWLNLRFVADRFLNIQELVENRLTMLPYLCSLPVES